MLPLTIDSSSATLKTAPFFGATGMDCPEAVSSLAPGGALDGAVPGLEIDPSQLFLQFVEKRPSLPCLQFQDGRPYHRPQPRQLRRFSVGRECFAKEMVVQLNHPGPDGFRAGGRPSDATSLHRNAALPEREQHGALDAHEREHEVGSAGDGSADDTEGPQPVKLLIGHLAAEQEPLFAGVHIEMLQALGICFVVLFSWSIWLHDLVLSLFYVWLAFLVYG
jgi:hypothetical protein